MSTGPFGALTIIADPRAGEGTVAARLPSVRSAIERTGLDHRFIVSDTPAEATRLATQALDDGYRYLAAVGDDGTVQDVVNGMFREGRPIREESVLAVIGADTGCDLVKSFGLPGDVDGAVDHLLGDTTYPLDVMKIAFLGSGPEAIRYAVNVAEIGFHAAALVRASKTSRRLGTARRFLGFWSAYVTEHVRDLRISVDGRDHDVRGWSVIVGNAQFADGGFRVSPRSFPGDGVLDALVYVGPKSDAYRRLPSLFRHGDHVPDPGIKELRAKLQVRVDADRPMPVVADGRELGSTPVAIQVEPQQILFKL
jgi:diacylglycerol kinase (ATP)